MPPRHRASGRLVAVVGALLVTAYAVVGVLQVLVWNPLATVPGRSLAEIHVELDRVGQSFSPVPPLLFGVAGVAIAGWLLVTALRSRDLSPLHVVIEFSLVLAAGAPALALVSFTPGMQLADGFLTTGGDHAPGAVPLWWTSSAAVVVAIAAAGVSVSRSRRTAAAAGPAGDPSPAPSSGPGAH